MRDQAQTASLGRRVRAARNALGLTQDDVAFAAAVMQVQVSHLELGLRLPSLFAVLRILGAVGLGVEVLQEGVGQGV